MINLQPDHSIIVWTSPINGMGDIVSAIKIAQDLITRGGVAATQVYLTGRNIEAFKNMMGTVQFTVISREVLTQRCRETAFTDRVALQIFIPDQGTLHILPGLSHVPSLLTTEYQYLSEGVLLKDLPFFKCAELGLKANAQGTQIGVQLSTPSDDVELSAAVQAKIHGKVYMAYAHHSQTYRAYVDAILELEEGAITFVLPGRAGKEISCKRENVRILSGEISRSDMAALEQMSERETVRTGDQSWAEGVSHDKVWAYEQLQHKDSFAASMHDLAGRGVTPCTVMDRYARSSALLNFFRDTDPEAMSTYNASLHAQDYFPRYVALINELLDQDTRASLTDLRSQELVLDPEYLRAGKYYLITLDQLLELKLDYEGQVDNGAIAKTLGGMKIKAPSMGPETYLVSKHD